MFTPNGFVLKQPRFRVVNMFVHLNQSSILNIWNIFKPHNSLVLAPIKVPFVSFSVLLNVWAATKVINEKQGLR